MTFTQPCFIRRNTAELRKKLEELGYSDETTRGKSHKSTCLSLKWDCYWNFGEADMVVADGSFGIDCGTNEELFLALAALREDTDKGQWFCDDNGLWEQTHSDLPSRYMQMHGHKATVPEILKHFNGTTN